MKSQEIQRLREKYVPKSLYQVTPVVVERAKGARIWDVDGREYIDFASGIGAINFGHSNEEIVEILIEQVKKFTHTCFHVTIYESFVRLAEKIYNLTGFKKSVFFNSGAEAVENAIKFSKIYTKKYNVISFQNSFHGRTLLGMSLTGKMKPYKLGFGPFNNVFHMPYAYCYRCFLGHKYPECGISCLDFLEKSFDTHLCDVASLIVEPVQGEGGFVVPPREFLKGLEDICGEREIVFIVDEIQSGMGRCGKMFAYEKFGVTPHLLVTGKSLGGGLPISGVSGNEIMELPEVGSIGGTFGGNPLSCVAGLKALEIVEKNLSNSERIGSVIEKRFSEFKDDFEIVGDVRGIGAMHAIELVEDRNTKKPAEKETKKVIEYCYKNGLIILSAGLFGNVVRCLPPIVATQEDVEKGLDTIEEALRKL